jgi:hypothetical protein
VLLPLVAACASEPHDVAVRSTPVVYGTDDRREYFDVQSAETRALVERSLVALVPKRALARVDGRWEVRAPSLRQAAALCPDDPFAEEPAAAFCTGVLVDWDLVLTSGHCTRAYAVGDVAAVFGYYYLGPRQLAVARDVYDVAKIEAEALDGAGARPRLDYAWLRLATTVSPPLEPAPLRLDVSTLQVGQPLTFVGTSGGTPLKIDSGATLHDPGAPWFDYFRADTDSARGASGGGAFDGVRALLGVLARGGADYVTNAGGCKVTAVRPPGAAPEEELTYAARAREGLCRSPHASSLCRPDCGERCRALPLDAAGCAAAPGTAARTSPLLFLLALAPRARRRGCGRSARSGR